MKYVCAVYTIPPLIERSNHRKLYAILQSTLDGASPFSKKSKYSLGAGDSLRNHDEQLLTEEVNELSKDIDEFQTFLTDQYAEELANNLEGNCTMQ